MAALNDQNINLFSVFWTNHLLSSCLLKTCNQKSRTLQTKKGRWLETLRLEIILCLFLFLKKTLKCMEKLQQCYFCYIKCQQYNIGSTGDSWQLQTKQRKSLKNFSELIPKLMKQVKCTIHPIKFICKKQFFSLYSITILLFFKIVCAEQNIKERNLVRVQLAMFYKQISQMPLIRNILVCNVCVLIVHCLWYEISMCVY